MSDEDPQWMAARFDHGKPKARMAGVLKAIDEGGPVGLLTSVYESAARAKHRDGAKACAELLKEAKARRANVDFALGGFQVATQCEAQAAWLPFMREVLAASGDPNVARAVADALRIMTGHAEEARVVLERALHDHPGYDDLRRDLAFLIVSDDPDAALAVIADVTEPVPLDAALRRLAALAKHDTREAHEQFDDFRVSIGADDVGTAMELASFHRSRNKVAVAAHLMEGTRLPSRHPEMTRDWLGLMTTLGHGQDAARQMRNRFGLKVPQPVSAETFLLLQPYDEELALAAYEVALGTVNPDGVADLRFRRLMLAKDWDAAMQIARSQPLLWIDFAERCESRALARVGRIGMRKAYARAPRVIGAEHEGLMRKGKLKGALTAAREIERDYEASHVGPERLAWTLAVMGDTDGAVAAGDLAVARDGACPRSAWARSLALALAGRWSDAVAEATRAHSIRQFGAGVTWADVVLEADRGGMLLEEVIAEHSQGVPAALNARAYDAMRARAAAVRGGS